MEQKSSIPHVLIFPYPAQGHINSMLKLAELLCLSGLHVTFINTEFNYSRLLRYTDAKSRFGRFPGFRFETISDGLPEDHPRSVGFLSLNDMFDQLKTVIKPAFREMVISDRLKSDVRNQITCIIADGILGFTIDVAEELGIPSIAFRTVSACCVYAYFCLPKLVENGDIPFKDEDMDRPVKSVPEMKSFLRCRDLPSFCRVKELNDRGLQFVETETFNSTRATAQILNTFEDLEGPVLNQLRSYWRNLYTIGPLHALLKSRKSTDSSQTVSSNGLWEEDRSCMAWLDLQPLKSVVYVSFGSLTMVNREQWLEFWYGLVNSGKRFLWVRRPDSFAVEEEECQIPAELVEGTRERGYMVEWAPQEEVLVHPAIGGFLTHSGWNSTLESMVAGVPMICWPHFADQQINSRYVSEVWKMGMDMKDKCDRSTVEKLVKDMMDDKREDLMRSTIRVSEKAKRSISEGGSSFRNFEALVDFIRKRV
ncbi:UDP-glucuronosyl/UDP-glucosyltransferase [Macleaya cordata]|uniref:Glycosyltransferase n=1 Tax=Macleaya cordata TaxID=56857 RepID=A0A200R4S7_MACCD|nr:UDP-glucuronosyl/UDP-glucosyltransferase [Macleaya cordata]